ncbi:MAG: ABC transporter permease [Spirochaetes bacterium]|nr:ABC transporter permease [Spirochaetota bacterium]MBU0955997.1 ABC transporter permease [Spirochaetota bacterium]
MFAIFFRNFLKAAFQRKTAWLLYFVAPLATFIVMFLLLSLNESAGFAAVQAVGMVLYLTMMQAVLIVSNILRDREQGVSVRITLAPASRLSYVAGNGLAALLVLTIQVLLVSTFIALVLPAGSGLAFLPLLFVLATFNLMCIGFGFLVCALAETSSGAIMLANILVLSTSLLGGSFIPVEFMGASLQKLAIVFPQFWAMRALRQLQSGVDLAQALLSLLIVFLFGLLFLAAQAALRRRNTH